MPCRHTLCVAFCWLMLDICQTFAFNNVVTLGDSLLDDPDGGRSPVAAEHVAERLGVPLTKFAVSGASSTDLIQHGQHTQAAAQFGAGDLAMLWIGGNDFFDNPFDVAFGNSAFLDTLESNANTAIATLRGAGMDVALFNLPNMSQVPGVMETVESVVPSFLRSSAYRNITRETIEWNTRLSNLATVHEATVIDVFEVFDELASDPGAFSLLGNEPILNADTGCQFCVFYDDPSLPDVHPASFAQGFIANEAIATLNSQYPTVNLKPLSIVELALLADLYAGDFDGNSLVDADDLAQWQDDFGGFMNAADADGDGDTDGADFLLWQRGFTGSAAASTVVPEPDAMILVLSLLSSVAYRPIRERHFCRETE